MGWTGKRCRPCNGTGLVYEKALDAELRCSACGGTGDEYDASVQDGSCPPEIKEPE